MKSLEQSTGKKETKLLVSGDPDWMRMMKVVQTEGPNAGRPRRLGIHAITAICGRDPLTILSEMEKSGKVNGYVCPDVRTPIYYLQEMSQCPGMVLGGSRQNECFKAGKEWIERYPVAKVKGFKRFPMYRFNEKTKMFEPDPNHKCKGEKKPMTWGCPDECYPMSVPFGPEDAAYEALVRKAVNG